MSIKKLIIGGVVSLVVVGTFSATVFASDWGRSGNTGSADAKYTVCSVETCTRQGKHTHNGTIYAPHNENDGHSYHGQQAEKPVEDATTLAYTQVTSQAEYALCPVEGCTEINDHQHDGVSYKPHSSDDGHGYHPQGVCPVQGCTQTGNHDHDGVTYGQHHNEDRHNYHNTPQGVCPVQGCTQTGNHSHDGVAYGQHHNEDGHAYHNQQNHESNGGHNNGHNGGSGRGGHH